MIRGMIDGNRPFLITRFGAGEMEALLRGIDVQSKSPVI